MESCLPENTRPHYINLRLQKCEALRAAYDVRKLEHRQEMTSKGIRRSGNDDLRAWNNHAEFVNKSVYAEFEALCETCELYGIPLDAKMCEQINAAARKSLVGKYRSTIQTTASGVGDLRIPNSVMQQLSEKLKSGRFPTLRDIAIEAERRRLASARRRNPMSGYNQALALRILQHLRETFPSKTNSGQLMRQVAPTETYREVLTAIEALHELGSISCVEARGNEGLVDAANITITDAGNAWLVARDNPTPGHTPVVVVHGDHNVNYGQAGVIGRSATGTQVNYGQIWQESQSQVDLQQIASELAGLRTELRKTATSVEDDLRVGLLAEAENEAKGGNGSKVLETLSRIGAPVLTKLLEAGASAGMKCLLNALNIPTV